jgi:hypothetical protein
MENEKSDGKQENCDRETFDQFDLRWVWDAFSLRRVRQFSKTWALREDISEPNDSTRAGNCRPARRAGLLLTSFSDHPKFLVNTENRGRGDLKW